ncbi:adenosyl cobinamide kinase/adenosyl cobinamide phosphate guanylyltransferase [Synechococcus sp. PCC 7502]|uniref:bifunctional adenosylcobinamide kinase/adenosylcobinamide-phosphate guanylyltransferase n=1 Tax=Synechococcus sp. PCC 7502 TaxID=1173263 RepID=UPI00029FBBF2|nr:bifunctional adenosylcobinamide kinase/adenosylcobinamide-phosphate guanylyltransferase [Synechococcus sp. PCC 7502]AFY74835.1 adenosyl cobinamide kinase/adenosyl cobinamide phosphate guanylyltransferase [Synechococcus sp. PCC 7502]
MITLITGASRSGKSEWAETLASQSGQPVIYIATARIDPSDTEWLQRIKQHSDRRPETWQTLEVERELAQTLESSHAHTCLLVDSLGTWVANLLDVEDSVWEKILSGFLTSLQITKSSVILVAEEVGWGVVPAYPMGRLFRDRLGLLVRKVGSFANPVYLVTGGHILNLSILGTRLPLESVN